MVDIARVNRQAQDYLLKDFGGIGAAIRPVSGSGIGQVQEFFLPGQGPAAFRDFANIAEADYIEDQTRGKPSDFAGGLTKSLIEGAVELGKSAAKNYPRTSLESPDYGLGSTFVRPNIGAMTEAERSAMEADEAVGIGGQLKQIARSLAEKAPADTVPSSVSEALTGLPSGTRGSGDFLPDAVVPGEPDEKKKEETGAADELAGEPDEKKDGEPYNPYGALLEKAMSEVTALRGEDPNKKTRKEYMEEFAEATGVNISGQPDKSHALMALGLSLMQNKAGKGFNVSKMLGALGEAGEAAMPAFQKAAETARAERVAAGKYALGEVKADAANRAVQLKAANQRVTDLMTKTVDAQVKMDLEAIQHANDVELKIAELEKAAADKALEGRYDYKNVGTLDDKGLPGFKTRVGIRKADGQSVYINAEDEIGIFASALADVNEGVDSLDYMKDLVISASQKKFGSNFERAKAWAEGVARGFKFDLDQVPIFEKVTRKNEETGETETVEVFTGEYKTEVPKAGELQTADAIRDRVIAQFKRFLTQETGNGISNVDIQNIERLLGQINFLDDPAAAITRIEEAKKIFLSKKGKIEARMSMYGDRNRHRNDAAYQETMRIGREALSKAYNLDPAIFGGIETTKDADGVEVIKLYQ